jgi:hypothetical protein
MVFAPPARNATTLYVGDSGFEQFDWSVSSSTRIVDLTWKGGVDFRTETVGEDYNNLSIDPTGNYLIFSNEPEIDVTWCGPQPITGMPDFHPMGAVGQPQWDGSGQNMPLRVLINAAGTAIYTLDESASNGNQGLITAFPLLSPGVTGPPTQFSPTGNYYCEIAIDPTGEFMVAGDQLANAAQAIQLTVTNPWTVGAKAGLALVGTPQPVRYAQGMTFNSGMSVCYVADGEELFTGRPSRAHGFRVDATGLTPLANPTGATSVAIPTQVFPHMGLADINALGVSK